VAKMVKAKNPAGVASGLKLLDIPDDDWDSAGKVSGAGTAANLCRTARARRSKSEIADQIGMQLRSIYDDVLAQPVPGRFLDLLQELERASDARVSKDRM
jgi:Anti-sigma factor NepR